MIIQYSVARSPEKQIIGVIIKDKIFCCHDMQESIKNGFIELIEENPPYLEYDTDGRWIESVKYCHHCGQKIILQRL